MRPLLLTLTLPLLLVASVVGLTLRPRVHLVIVNPAPTPAEVRVHGDLVGVPANGALRLEGLPAAGLRLEAPGEAALEPACAPGSTWVWTVAPVTTWWEVSQGYGDLGHITSSARPFAAPGPLFPLPDDGFLSVVDAPLPRAARVKRGTTGAVLSGLWSDAYAGRVAPREANIEVHNGSRATVRLEAEGAPAIEMPPGGVTRIEGVPPGTLPLRAVVVDASGDGRVYSVDAVIAPGAPLAPPPTYVWDVDGTTRWWVVSRRYGPGLERQPPPPPPRELEAQPPFFRLPDGFFPEVDAPFPETWHVAEVLEVLRCESRHAPSLDGAELPPGLRRMLEARRPGIGEAPAPTPTPDEPAPFPPVDEGR